jgi:putative PIN family toxin of toxin-antitoxin system
VRVVFDTNVLIAAFLTEGVCSTLLVRARRGECELILSTDIIQEFERILRKKFSLSQSEISDVRKVLAEATKEVRQMVNPIAPVCRDPDDDRILACAHEAHADYIVTGDEGLLVLKRYGAIRIVTPRNFESLFPE